MTFEEFFIKKKIDLLLLKEAEPLLYQEFRNHFEQMGEKSFDHTKKYWFNRLRKSFHLKEVIEVAKPVIAKTSPLDENKVIASKEAPQAVKPSGFKPRFKPAASKLKETDQPEATTSETANDAPAPQQAKPLGFKPRFKAGLTNKTQTPEDSDAEKSEETKAQENKIDSASEVPKEPTAKPLGFKPRFKAGLTNKTQTPEDSDAEKNEETKAQENKIDSAPEAPKEPTAKPLGFKPRFKPGMSNRKDQSNDS